MSRDALASRLRRLPGCSTLISTDLEELSWKTKQRVFLSLLAELPEGKDAIVACAQLHPERRGNHPGARSIRRGSLESDDQFRGAFYAEIAGVLAGMGAPPAFKAKKLQADADCCLRAIEFLASRVHPDQDLGSPAVGRRRARARQSFRTRKTSPGGEKATVTDALASCQLEESGTSEPPSTVVEGEGTPCREIRTREESDTTVCSNGVGGDPGRLPRECSDTSNEEFHTHPEEIAPNANQAVAHGAAPKLPNESGRASRREIHGLHGDAEVDPRGPSLVSSSAGGKVETSQPPTRAGRREAGRGVHRIRDAGGKSDAVRCVSFPDGRRKMVDEKSNTTRDSNVFPVSLVSARRQDSPNNVARASKGGGVGASSLPSPGNARDAEQPRKGRGTPPSEPASRRIPQGSPRGLFDARDRNSKTDAGLTYEVGDAIGLEIGILEGVGSGGLTATGSWKQCPSREGTPDNAVSHAQVEALRAENSRLRQRIEELEEFLEIQASVGRRAWRTPDSAGRRDTGAPVAAGVSSRGGYKQPVVKTRNAGRADKGSDKARSPRPVGATGDQESASLEAARSEAAVEAILRGQVAQLRRQVRLQWCAVDASAAVTREVKSVLHQLEGTLSEICSLGRFGAADPANEHHAGKDSRPSKRHGASTAAGGVCNAETLPTWHQLRSRVQKLSREIAWAERAAQRAADGRLHVTRESGSFLQPGAPARGLRRPRDIRFRALDPDHFTSTPPCHGAVHQQPPGAIPAEGHASVLEGTPPTRQVSGRKVSMAVKSAAFSAEMADVAAAEAVFATNPCPAVPDVHELYHLDAGSLAWFTEAASSATRALGSLVALVELDGRDEEEDGSEFAERSCPLDRLASPGVTPLLIGGQGNHSSVNALVDIVAGIRDKFRQLVVAATALGAVVQCAPDGAGSPSTASSAPSLRLLRGVKAAGGGDGARRLEALARRLPAERAALETVVAVSHAETRAWRGAAKKQASAVHSLAQGLRDAWTAYIRKTCSLSRPLTAVLNALRDLLSSAEAAPILRGSAGSCAAAMLQTLALFEPELEDAVLGVRAHSRRSEEQVSRLWEAFEVACWPSGVGREPCLGKPGDDDPASTDNDGREGESRSSTEKES